VPVLLFLLAIGLTTAGLLGVLLIALIRHLRVLAESVRRFQQEIQPLLEDLAQDSSRAQGRLEDLSRRGPSDGLGARIRG
jgi:hypothetical protein